MMNKQEQDALDKAVKALAEAIGAMQSYPKSIASETDQRGNVTVNIIMVAMGGGAYIGEQKVEYKR
jgi:hypothetical protein